LQSAPLSAAAAPTGRRKRRGPCAAAPGGRRRRASAPKAASAANAHVRAASAAFGAGGAARAAAGVGGWAAERGGGRGRLNSPDPSMVQRELCLLVSVGQRAARGFHHCLGNKHDAAAIVAVAAHRWRHRTRITSHGPRSAPNESTRKPRLATMHSDCFLLGRVVAIKVGMMERIRDRIPAQVR
jgi:hypothetical protein